MDEETRAIVFFDGECGLCHRSVQFLIDQDADGALSYAPLQGETAAQFIAPELRAELSTIIYRSPDGAILLRSSAALQAIIDTRSQWRHLAKLALWLPNGLRDWFYDRIAKRRHRWFSAESCRIPSKTVTKKILP